MADLVVTCPKGIFLEWIAEGDAAGEPYTGEEWGWFMNTARPPIEPGDRLYVVAHARLRGFSPVTALKGLSFDPAHGADDLVGVYVDVRENPKVYRRGNLVAGAEGWCICRRGDAVAVTVDEPIPGFRGWRRRWWDRAIEKPFPEWRTP